MSGIYLHIPFCKSRCYYCDFYSCTEVSKMEEYVEILKYEIIDRKKYLSDTVDSIYFGGGTPSVLSIENIESILKTITEHYKLSKNVEITLEANPDDLNTRSLKLLARTPINRLSIGIQSMDNYFLKLMNRRHSAEQAIQAVEQARRFGFDNISVDLIYGIPGLTERELRSSLQKIAALEIQHLSAYHITYEKDTVFDLLRQKGLLNPISDDESYYQYKLISDWATQNNFIHYEISNFGKLGRFSKHNSSYWRQQPYLGVGASAHSYNINKRRWNIDNINEYLNYKIKNGEIYKEESLTKVDRFNELLLTSLRTSWGIDIKQVEHEYGSDYAQLLLSTAERYEAQGYLTIQNNNAILTEKGFFISDKIISDMFTSQ
ncbi:MAG: radical SAM family heme chaperone HemW [Salinivirgaceae bacterium]|nr:radical SAM family heme chaperone HemW [Salinivirgaceae bacterium]MDD4747195.1 radical SAM family heme chaperone HemW [Salinivirgaceae bacterium]MDY0279441.1 radical SAM family heme chaperone HemW [Salinivirgaceae bacterium]